MAKSFNTTAICVPSEHYMVNLDKRLKEIKQLVDAGKYFTINKARQYGKTTTLMALSQYLRSEYYVVFMDFQTIGSAEFATENYFSLSFAGTFLRLLERQKPSLAEIAREAVENLRRNIRERNDYFTLNPLFRDLEDICEGADRPLVLIIDEVDSASNAQVFLDFLAQLRAQYITRFQQAAFRSVILAGVYDIRNLKQKIRPESEHKYNSPWNIAADFKVEMSFSKEEIAGMLQEYERDYATGMDIASMAGMIYDYTSGYPFLVSRICQLIDEEIGPKPEYGREAAWTEKGFLDAVRMLLTEKNLLFDSLIGKLYEHPDLSKMLRSLLFTGKDFNYNAYDYVINMAVMFGFVIERNGNAAISNRIFETLLYNFYLSENEMKDTEIYKASLEDRNQFIADGYLDMKRVLERFVVHFHDIYGSCDHRFLEEEGRRFFLLYIRPIINGAGNYYVESRTRSLGRTDLVIDYHGRQYIVEMKLWHGEEYNRRGEEQLLGYLNDYHIDRGYMLSFNFNKAKEVGVHEIMLQGKTIIEAVV